MCLSALKIVKNKTFTFQVPIDFARNVSIVLIHSLPRDFPIFLMIVKVLTKIRSQGTSVLFHVDTTVLVTAKFHGHVK